MLIKQGMTAAVLAWLVLSGCGGAEPSGGEAPGGSMLPGSGVTGVVSEQVTRPAICCAVAV